MSSFDRLRVGVKALHFRSSLPVFRYRQGHGRERTSNFFPELPQWSGAFLGPEYSARVRPLILSGFAPGPVLTAARRSRRTTFCEVLGRLGACWAVRFCSGLCSSNTVVIPDNLLLHVLITEMETNAPWTRGGSGAAVPTVWDPPPPTGVMGQHQHNDTEQLSYVMHLSFTCWLCTL